MNQVIVFGKESYNTLGVIRSLGENGVSVFLLMLKTSMIQYCGLSKYVTKEKKVITVEEGIQFLIHEYPTIDGKKTIIIPTGDLIASELDKHFDILSEKFIFPNAGSQGGLNEIMDKYYMTKIAEQSGLHVPFSIDYRCGQPLPDNVVFPCMVKSAKSIEGSKEEMRICNSIEELLSATSYQNKGHQLLIQQYIQKEYDILLLGSRCPKGKVFLSGVFKKLRWFSMGNDGSFGLITTNIEQWFDRSVVENFLQNLNYVGPFSIECGVENGIPYFFEINLRNDGTSHYFDATRFCNAYAWSMECAGHEVEYNGHGDYWFIDEFGDFMNVVARTITCKQWRQDKKRATVFKYKNLNDKKPMMVIQPYMCAFVAKHAMKLLLNRNKQ